MKDENEQTQEFQSALLCCFGERRELSVAEGRSRLVVDGEMFSDRSARSIQLIRAFCDDHLADTEYNWLEHMRPNSNNPVVGFDADELAQYPDANAAARRFIIENLYEVLFPDRKGVFE